MDPELADLQEAQGETLRQEFPPPGRGYLGREAEWVLSLPDICSDGLPGVRVTAPTNSCLHCPLVLLRAIVCRVVCCYYSFPSSHHRTVKTVTTSTGSC